MSEAVSPSPKSHRRLWIILAAVLILVIALLVGSFFLASSKASSAVSDYHHDFKAWEAKDESALLSATAAIPTGTYVTESDSSTKANLAKEKRACQGVASSIDDLKAQSSRLPVMPSSALLGKVSSDYKAAGKTSDRRAKVVRAYTKQALGILAQIHRDCSWNVDWNGADVKSIALFKKAEKYLMKQGATEPGAICREKDGCVSSIASKKNTFADLRIKAYKLEQKRVLSLLKSKRCADTSYGAACPTLAKNYGVDVKLGLAYDTYIRSTANTIENAGMESRRAKITKFEKTLTPNDAKALVALEPALKNEPDVKKHPLWTDNFFEVMDKRLLAKLDAQRLALEKL